MTEPPCPNHRVAFYGRTNQTGTDDHRDVARRYVRCLPVILRLGWCWLAGWYYDLAVAPGRTQAHQAAVWDGGGPRCRDGGSSEPAAELALPQVHVVLLSDYERLPRQLRRCQPLMAAAGRHRRPILTVGDLTDLDRDTDLARVADAARAAPRGAARLLLGVGYGW